MVIGDLVGVNARGFEDFLGLIVNVEKVIDHLGVEDTYLDVKWLKGSEKGKTFQYPEIILKKVEVK